MMHTLILDGHNLADYACYVSMLGTYKGPKRDYDEIIVHGRNGFLTHDNGRYDGYEIKYNCWIADNFQANYKAVRQLITKLKAKGPIRVEEEADPDAFRIGVLSADELEPDVMAHRAATFEIGIKYQPERWLKSGEIPITVKSGSTLINPTMFTACPVIDIHGSGTLLIGSTSITVASGADDHITLDCVNHLAYEGTVNRGNLITLTDWPLLDGPTAIKYTGIKSVVIIPNWRTF